MDAQLLARNDGKETNIRILNASLKMVLWPELGWQKIGMEVVTPSQVKVRYMKAIAKLHPDKVCFFSSHLVRPLDNFLLVCIYFIL